jgi:hypothetical protein
MTETETPPRSEAETPDTRLIHGVGSVVTLDYRTGVVKKTYKPKFAVRALYWAAFQAPFPYSNDRDALEASRQRRIVVGLLTKFWFGMDLVAPVLEVAEDDKGDMAFKTKLIIGRTGEQVPRPALPEAADKPLHRGRPADLAGKPLQPALGRQPDGGRRRHLPNHRPGIQPGGGIDADVGGHERHPPAELPNFDDIDTRQLEAYLGKNGHRIREKLE